MIAALCGSKPVPCVLRPNAQSHNPFCHKSGYASIIPSRFNIGIQLRRAFLADLVQDMYLKELKAYKVPPAKSSDAQGQVQTFKIPSPPKAPSDTSEMAESLKAYDTQPVEVEMQSTSSGPGATLPSKDEEWLELDEDEPAESGKASH